MRYLLDTDWAIQAIGGRSNAVTALLRVTEFGVAVSFPSLGELYDGIVGASNAAARLVQLEEFLEPFAVIGIDAETMFRFAEIRSTLRRRGELIPDFDTLIAATALQHDLTLLTYNVRHFHRITDLLLYQETP